MSHDPLGSFRDQLVDGVGGEARRRRRRRRVSLSVQPRRWRSPPAPWR